MANKETLVCHKEIDSPIVDIVVWIEDYSETVAPEVDLELNERTWGYLYFKHKIPYDENLSVFHIILNSGKIINRYNGITSGESEIGILKVNKSTDTRTSISARWDGDYTYAVDIFLKQLFIKFYSDDEFSSSPDSNLTHDPLTSHSKMDNLPVSTDFRDYREIGINPKIDNIETKIKTDKSAKKKSKRQISKKRQERAYIFKEIKDNHPDFTYEKVADEATYVILEQYSVEAKKKYPTWESSTCHREAENKFRDEWKKPQTRFHKHDVINDYQAMGWNWIDSRKTE